MIWAPSGYPVIQWGRLYSAFQWNLSANTLHFGVPPAWTSSACLILHSFTLGKPRALLKEFAWECRRNSTFNNHFTSEFEFSCLDGSERKEVQFTMEKSPGFLFLFAFLVAMKLCLTSQVEDEVRNSFLHNRLLFLCITLSYRENNYQMLYLIAEKPTLTVTGAYNNKLYNNFTGLNYRALRFIII